MLPGRNVRAATIFALVEGVRPGGLPKAPLLWCSASSSPMLQGAGCWPPWDSGCAPWRSPLTLHPTHESPICFLNLLSPQFRTSFLSAAVCTTSAPASDHTRCMTCWTRLPLQRWWKAPKAYTVNVSAEHRMPSRRSPFFLGLLHWLWHGL